MNIKSFDSRWDRYKLELAQFGIENQTTVSDGDGGIINRDTNEKFNVSLGWKGNGESE